MSFFLGNTGWTKSRHFVGSDDTKTCHTSWPPLRNDFRNGLPSLELARRLGVLCTYTDATKASLGK